MPELIRTYFLSVRRSPLYDTKLITRIFTFLGVGYLLFNLVFVGFFLDKLFLKIKPNSAPIDCFSRYFLFLFAADIMFKFFIKSYKKINVFPYLTLPVPRKKVYALLFIKELLSGWNFIWIVLLASFFFKTMYPVGGLASVFLLLLSVYFICITISFIIRYIDVFSIWKSFSYTFIPLLFVLIVACAAYFAAVAPRLFINVGLIFSQYKLWVFIVLLVLFFCLFTGFQKSCRRELYVQLSGRKKSAVSLDFSWLNNFGLNGEIMKLCLKEIMRSQLKRTAIISFFILAYSIYIMLNAKQGVFFSQYIFAMFPTIMLGTALGTFTYGAESTFFDKLMSYPKNIPYLILRIKYTVCVLFSLLCMIVYSCVFFHKIPILHWLSVFFYGCGSLFFIFQMAVYKKQRIDVFAIPKFLNNTIYDFLSMGCLMLSWGVLYSVYKFVSATATEYFMLFIGIICMATSPLWLKNIYNRFLIRKYQSMDVFRTNEQ